MATESEEDVYSCEYCDASFEGEERLHEHVQEAHDEDSGASEDAAVAGTDASGSTGSITEENNESPSAAEPSEAAGPSNDDDIEPDSDEDD